MINESMPVLGKMFEIGHLYCTREGHIVRAYSNREMEWVCVPDSNTNAHGMRSGNYLTYIKPGTVPDSMCGRYSGTCEYEIDIVKEILP